MPSQLEELQRLSKVSADKLFSETDFVLTKQAKEIVRNAISKILDKFPTDLAEMNESHKITYQGSVEIESPPPTHLLSKLREIKPELVIGCHQIGFYFTEGRPVVQYGVTAFNSKLLNQYKEETFNEYIDQYTNYLLDTNRLTLKEYNNCEYSDLEKYRESGKRLYILDKLDEEKFAYFKNCTTDELFYVYEKEKRKKEQATALAIEEIQYLAKKGYAKSSSHTDIDYENMNLEELQERIREARYIRKKVMFQNEYMGDI